MSEPVEPQPKQASIPLSHYLPTKAGWIVILAVLALDLVAFALIAPYDKRNYLPLQIANVLDFVQHLGYLIILVMGLGWISQFKRRISPWIFAALLIIPVGLSMSKAQEYRRKSLAGARVEESVAAMRASREKNGENLQASREAIQQQLAKMTEDGKKIGGAPGAMMVASAELIAQVSDATINLEEKEKAFGALGGLSFGGLRTPEEIKARRAALDDLVAARRAQSALQDESQEIIRKKLEGSGIPMKEFDAEFREMARRAKEIAPDRARYQELEGKVLGSYRDILGDLEANLGSWTYAEDGETVRLAQMLSQDVHKRFAEFVTNLPGWMKELKELEQKSRKGLAKQQKAAVDSGASPGGKP